MGEVYQARDARLGRDVALKILPPQVASDPDHVARFDREARLLASLNHPNIATLHGFEAADGIRFLVMELVGGATLAERFKAGPMSVEEALPVFVQIAEGLEAAHEAGVVHRDLKPGNVKITPDGRVKILDFGLAKAVSGAADPSGDLSRSPTLTALATQRGEVMGTAAYMSPEQARGRPVDRRADIWAFGCCLYEALAGSRAFTGETATDVLAAIVKDDPDWTALPAGTPPAIEDLLRRCLVKDPRGRLRDAGDARLEIARILSAGRGAAASGSTRAAAGAPPAGLRDAHAPDAGARPAWRVPAAVAAAALLGAAAGAAVAMRAGSSAPAEGSAGPVRVLLEAPPGLVAQAPRLSPDGGTVVFYGVPERIGERARGRSRLYSRPLGAWESRPIEGTEGASAFAFSPDGRWLAVAALAAPGSSKLRLVKVPLEGGAPPLTLAGWSEAWDERRLAWLPDGDVIVSTRPPVSLVRIRSDGSGTATSVKLGAGAPAGELRLQDVLPDGRRVLATTPSWEAAGFREMTLVVDLASGEVATVLEEGASPRWSPTGHLLFTRRDTLLAAPFDPEPGGRPGEAVALARGLRLEREDAGSWFHVSRTGSLIYQPGGHVGAKRRVVVVDRAGSVTPWSADEQVFVSRVAVSPDGGRLAVPVMREDWLFTIWGSETARPRLRMLAARTSMDCDVPVWHPSGQVLFFSCTGGAGASGVYSIAFEGGVARRIVAKGSAAPFLDPRSASPDASWLIVKRHGGDETTLLLHRLDAGAGEEPESALRSLLPPDVRATDAAFSPEGRWIAYVSRAAGRPEVYVASFGSDGGVGPAALAGAGPAGEMFWAAPASGGAPVLFYEAEPSRLASVTVRGGPMPSVSEPAPAFDLSKIDPPVYGLSPLPDGRLVGIQQAPEEAGTRQMLLTLNWSGEILRLAPPGR
jgi:serine/threonine-protein kinase